MYILDQTYQEQTESSTIVTSMTVLDNSRLRHSQNTRTCGNINHAWRKADLRDCSQQHGMYLNRTNNLKKEP